MLSYGLALTLVIWTGLLSQSHCPFWFGSHRKLQFWINFDLLMVGMLIGLGYGAGKRAKFVQWLAPLALLATLGDMCVTTWQAFAFFDIHPLNWISLLAWLLASSGPIIASFFLAGITVAFRSRRVGS